MSKSKHLVYIVQLAKAFVACQKPLVKIPLVFWKLIRVKDSSEILFTALTLEWHHNDSKICKRFELYRSSLKMRDTCLLFVKYLCVKPREVFGYRLMPCDLMSWCYPFMWLLLCLREWRRLKKSKRCKENSYAS